MEYRDEEKFIAFVEKQIRRIEQSKQETAALREAHDKDAGFYTMYDLGLEMMLSTVCDHFGFSLEGIREEIYDEEVE